jgi:hypothetical protein
MNMLHLDTSKIATALIALTAATPACDDPDGAEIVVDTADDASERDAPLDALQDLPPAPTSAVYPFTIFNPDGKSKTVRVTAEIKSGTGVVTSIGVRDSSPFVEIFDMACDIGALGSKKCQTFKYALPCQNYGNMVADVEYTGSVRPTLHYWFDNC